MIEFVPYIFHILLSLATGLVAIILYRKSGKFGLVLISVTFFLSVVPSMVNLAMGGPYLYLRLREQGYTPVEIGVFSVYLFLLNSAFQIVFTIVVIAGLVKSLRRLEEIIWKSSLLIFWLCCCFYVSW
jgi:hypothetical protein